MTVKRAMIAGMVVASLGLASGSALGQEPPRTLDRALWTGPSLGVPSGAKRAVLTSLYAASVVSLVGTGYFAYAWMKANDEVADSDEQGVCFELASRECREFMGAQADVRGAQRYTAATAATAAGFLLSGILVAQYWSNTVVDLNVSPVVASVQFTASF